MRIENVGTSKEIAADIRRLKQKRLSLTFAIEALEILCVEALLLESGYSKRATETIMELYDTAKCSMKE